MAPLISGLFYLECGNLAPAFGASESIRIEKRPLGRHTPSFLWKNASVGKSQRKLGVSH